jgi:hypothetical protein
MKKLIITLLVLATGIYGCEPKKTAFISTIPQVETMVPLEKNI